MVNIPITNGYNISNSLPVSSQECSNWYVKNEGEGALSSQVLVGTPGLILTATSGMDNQINRGALTMSSEPYFVNGDGLVRLESDETLTKLGAIDAGGRVSMATNGDQLMILIPGGSGYIYTKSLDTLVEITDPDFTANGAPQQVVFIDGYFLITTDSKKFIVSAINDGTSYNALDFGTAESSPDDIVAPIVFRNQLFIGGSTTLEGFDNVGGAGFPFQRNGLFIDKGVAAPFSVSSSNDTFLFVGGGERESAAVWAFEGNTVTKVSNPAIDALLSDLSGDDVSNISSWSYASNGSYFVGFNLPAKTMVFDSSTGKWHERSSTVTDSLGQKQTLRCRINSIAQSYGALYAGDSQGGNIGAIDDESYKEYDQSLIRSVSTQQLYNNSESFLIPSIELTIESGVGNNDVIEPLIAMSRSIDGGKTWKDQKLRKMGRVGEYIHRCIWRRNGRASRFEVFKFTLTDAVKPVIINLIADII